jgi:hypothetical protein
VQERKLSPWRDNKIILLFDLLDPWREKLASLISTLLEKLDVARPLLFGLDR